jgi:hypothetical protein
VMMPKATASAQKTKGFIRNPQEEELPSYQLPQQEP